MKLLELKHWADFRDPLFIDARSIVFFLEDDDKDIMLYFSMGEKCKITVGDDLAYICDFLKKNNIPFIQLHMVDQDNTSKTMPCFICINHIRYIQRNNKDNFTVINMKHEEIKRCFEVKEDYEVVLHMYHEAMENSNKNRD